jgi:hypothetical protein
MKTNLFSVLVDATGLGSSGAADAANVAAPTDNQVVILTDTQIDAVAGGHLAAPPAPGTGEHDGTYWEAGISIWPPGPSLEIATGPHTECGDIPCLPV